MRYKLTTLTKHPDINELIRLLEIAIALPGKAPISTALLICGESIRLNRCQFLLITPRVIKASGLSRISVYRGMERLESEGLIQVDRMRGRSPLVNLLKINK